MTAVSFEAKLTLPELDPDIASFFSDCCLSLSAKVIRQILNNLPSWNSVVLSVGSGTGLLEALLSGAMPDIRFEVAEVRSVNKYMPDDQVHIVNGTWDTCQRARDCDALMFVYPRDPSLITKYIAMCDDDTKVRSVLWIGPMQDWPVFNSSFEDSAFKLARLVQLSPSEKLASFERVA